MSATMFFDKLRAIQECDAISFYKYKKLNKEILEECLDLYITPLIDRSKIKRAMVDNG